MRDENIGRNPKIRSDPTPVAEQNQQKPNINIDPKFGETHHNGSLAKMGHEKKSVDRRNGSKAKLGLWEKKTIISPNQQRSKTS